MNAHDKHVSKSSHDELEARIVAMLLGNCNETDTSELMAMIEQDAELNAFYQSMRSTIGLIEKVNLPADDTLPKLSDDRRQTLLQTIATAPTAQTSARFPYAKPVMAALAACLVLGLTVNYLLPRLDPPLGVAQQNYTSSASPQEDSEAALIATAANTAPLQEDPGDDSFPAPTLKIADATANDFDLSIDEMHAALDAEMATSDAATSHSSLRGKPTITDPFSAEEENNLTADTDNTLEKYTRSTVVGSASISAQPDTVANKPEDINVGLGHTQMPAFAESDATVTQAEPLQSEPQTPHASLNSDARQSTMVKRNKSNQSRTLRSSHEPRTIRTLESTKGATSNVAPSAAIFAFDRKDASLQLAAAILQKGLTPDPGTIQSEAFLNAFDYRDPAPEKNATFALHWELAQSPWQDERYFLRLAITTSPHNPMPQQPLATAVNIQVIFNPDRVYVYRKIGYIKDRLTRNTAAEETVDIPEVEQARTGNALYSIGIQVDGKGDLGMLRIRYRTPTSRNYRERVWRLRYPPNIPALSEASPSLRVACVATLFAEYLSHPLHSANIDPARLKTYLRDLPPDFAADTRILQLRKMIQQAEAQLP